MGTTLQGGTADIRLPTQIPQSFFSQASFSCTVRINGVKGNGIRRECEAERMIRTGNGARTWGNYSPGNFTLVGNKKDALKQFHFHRPSEEKVYGEGLDMTVHLVHADDHGNLAIVAVLLQACEGSPLVHELWNDLPKDKGKKEFLDNVKINLSQILPSDRGYYTFTASLTTPPCTGGITRFVLNHPATISAEGIERFSQLYRDDARPIQPLYDRVVLESQ